MWMTREEVQRIRDRYPQGTRLELSSMDDPYTRLQPGEIMLVDFVDDAGQIHRTGVIDTACCAVFSFCTVGSVQ